MTPAAPDEDASPPAETAVVFDLDGTLVEFTRPWAEILADVVADRIGRDDDRLLEAFSTAFFERFEPVRPEPYRHAARALFDAADVEGDSDAFVAALRRAEYDHLAAVEGARDLLETLDDQPLGVLTNGVTEWQVGKLERVGLRDRFDAVVTSYDAGASKPEPAAFDRVEERLPAERYVMIGDDPEEDVAAARGRGWQAVHVDDGAGGVSAGSTADLAALLDALR